MDRVREFLRLPPAGAALDGRGVRVAVLDTGVDATHPDLEHVIAAASASLDPLDSRLIDEVGHGTHVAGIIAGSGEASRGLYRGVAPGVEVLALRVGTTDRAKSDTVASAVEMAVDLGAHVINYSAGAIAPGMPPPWVWPTRKRALDRAFEYATRSGVLCVAAAGNDGPAAATIVAPGVYREVLAVGSIGTNGVVAHGSARGPVYLDASLRKGEVSRYDSSVPGSAKQASYLKPDLVAPGGEFEPFSRQDHRRSLIAMELCPDGVVSCRGRDGKYPGLAEDRHGSPYTMIPGTSMAAAIVSGLAALAIQYGEAVGLDWGENRATALRNLLSEAAQPLSNGAPEDFGRGAPIWPAIAAVIDDCVANKVRCAAVLRGPQLHLLDDQP